MPDFIQNNKYMPDGWTPPDFKPSQPAVTPAAMNTSKSLKAIMDLVFDKIPDHHLKPQFREKVEAAIVEAVEGLADKLTYAGELNATSTKRRHSNGIIDPLEFKMAIKEWQ